MSKNLSKKTVSKTATKKGEKTNVTKLNKVIKKTNLVVPLDADLKEKVKKILEELGLNQSQIDVTKLNKVIKKTNLVVPLDADLKEKVKKILEELGLNQSQIDVTKLNKVIKKTNLVVPLDADLKEKVKKILEELGLNQSQIVLALFKEIARTHKIPLSFDLADAVFAGTPWENARNATPEEARAIDEGLASGIATQKEVEELEKELGIKLAF